MNFCLNFFQVIISFFSVAKPFLQDVDFSNPDLQAFETFFFRFELWQETGSIAAEGVFIAITTWSYQQIGLQFFCITKMAWVPESKAVIWKVKELWKEVIMTILSIENNIFFKWNIYFIIVMSNNDDRWNSSLIRSYVSRLIQLASKN